MTNETALIRGIIANPTDDTIRLAYADCLIELDDPMCPACNGAGLLVTEHGSTFNECGVCLGAERARDFYKHRAEFIQLQIEMARTGETPDRFNRMMDFIMRYADQWIPPCPVLYNAGLVRMLPGNLVTHHGCYYYDGRTVNNVYVDFHRGFPEHITCSGTDWTWYGDDIRAINPITRVTVTDPPDWEDDQHDYFSLVGDPQSKRFHLYQIDAMRGVEPYWMGVLRLRFPGIEFVDQTNGFRRGFRHPHPMPEFIPTPLSPEDARFVDVSVRELRRFTIEPLGVGDYVVVDANGNLTTSRTRIGSRVGRIHSIDPAMLTVRIVLQ